jgi:hypothetical protein
LKPWPSHIKCLKCRFLGLFDTESVDAAQKCCNIEGFACEKAELSTQTKALRVVRGVDDGSKTDLGTSSNQAVAIKLQCAESWGAQGASWEILK